jgi:hypothetical protein
MVQTDSRLMTERLTPDEAADRAVDPQGLLEGEDPASTHPDDIEHWINVYSELIRFKEGILTGTKQGVAEMREAEPQKEAGEVDLTILTTQLERYRDRLRFWQARREDNQSDGA